MYQHGKLGAMLTPDDILARLEASGLDLGADALMFCGTLPLITGAFVYGSTYELEMRLPNGMTLGHSYEVKRKGE